MVTALWLKHQINDNKVCVMVSLSNVCGISGTFYIMFYAYNGDQQMFGGKILLTNVTKTNEHSNVTRFVHALIYTVV